MTLDKDKELKAGETRLYSGEKISKRSKRIEWCGDIDELVSYLGLAKFSVVSSKIKKELHWIQCQLFRVASEMATSSKKLSLLENRINLSDVELLNEKRDTLSKLFKTPTGFIVPGTNLASAYLDICRAHCRKVERSIVRADNEGFLENKYLLTWLNRLSDYIYLLSRKTEKKYDLLKDYT